MHLWSDLFLNFVLHVHPVAAGDMIPQLAAVWTQHKHCLCDFMYFTILVVLNLNIHTCGSAVRWNIVHTCV
jgi:hypothetical protein